MPSAPRWITLSAASALGLGLLATGAVGIANAIPLVDSTTTADVPPISTVPESATGDVKGSGDVTFPVPASSPDVSSSAAPPVALESVSPVSPASVDSDD